MESDGKKITQILSSKDFNSRSHVESDNIRHPTYTTYTDFNSRSHVESDKVAVEALKGADTFQFTLSRGERP